MTPASAVWVGEQSTRPVTTNPELVKITTSLHEQYCQPNFWRNRVCADGVSGDFAAAPNGFNAVKKLFYTLKAGYRINGKWLCNSATALSLLKDGNDNYLWSEGNITSGAPATILGKEVVISESARPIAANSKNLWFGDWNQALRGIERPGNKLLLDPFSDKPNLRVYVYRTFGLQLRNNNAVKVLKFSAT